jgi:hypothetical protein
LHAHARRRAAQDRASAGLAHASGRFSSDQNQKSVESDTAKSHRAIAHFPQLDDWTKLRRCRPRNQRRVLTERRRRGQVPQPEYDIVLGLAGFAHGDAERR